LGGCGIAILATFIVGDDLKCGRLQMVLPEWTIPETDISAILAAGSHIPFKIQVFVDFFANRFRGVPYWDAN
jgi:DNA-binding transcriptional LysR family regulator